MYWISDSHDQLSLHLLLIYVSSAVTEAKKYNIIRKCQYKQRMKDNIHSAINEI